VAQHDPHKGKSIVLDCLAVRASRGYDDVLNVLSYRKAHINPG